MKKICIVLFFSLFVFSIFGTENPAPVKLVYYGETGCSHCDLFEGEILPDIERQTGVQADLQAFDILNAERYAECALKLSEMGIDFSIFPVLFVGNNAYLGNSSVEKGLTDELAYYKKHGEYRPFNAYLSSGAGSFSLKILPVLLAGLIDGINPCAFATLIFFISFLTAQGRSRREILVTGTLFTFSVYLTYFLLGLGLLNTMRLIIDFSFVRFIMKCAVSIVTGIFLLLSLRDFYLARSGRYREITLQLSLPIKKRLHGVIRKNTGKKLFLGGVIITGFLVSIIELACTGQVYLPTIAYMIQTDISVLGIRSLVMYNLGFIVPLVVVFLAVYTGISSTVLSGFFTRKIHFTKLALSIVFLFLAIVIWFV